MSSLNINLSLPRASLPALQAVLALTFSLLNAATPLHAQSVALCGDSVTVHRDSYGVPHVVADSLPAAMYGHGWAQAHDRLWQAEIFRRVATGTMAEWFGPGQIESDVLSRTLFGNAESRAAIWSEASDEAKASMAAFADGMNAGIDHLADAKELPPQYGILGVTPRPWTVDDSVALGMLVSWDFGIFIPDQLANVASLEALINAYGPEEGMKRFGDTRYLNDPSSPVSMAANGCAEMMLVANEFIQRDTAIDADQSATPTINGLPMETTGRYRELAREMTTMKSVIEEQWSPILGGSEHSNAVLLGPSMTADGNALLFGGPQMGRPQPQSLHEVATFTPDVNVRGFGLAGAPGVNIGATPTHAWMLTSGSTNNTDFFLVTQNPENPGEYYHDGEWIALGCYEEEIPVAGGGEHVATICQTVFGPVVGTGDGLLVSLKNPAQAHFATHFQGFLELATADTVEKAEYAASLFAYNFNVLYANASGDIAQFHVGRIPIRSEGSNPFLPLNGSDGDDWVGIIDWEDMPRIVNPESGIIVNWNNKPRCDWDSIHRNGQRWGPVHRVQTLIAMMEEVEPGTATLETLKQINEQAGKTAMLPFSHSANTPVTGMIDLMLEHVDEGVDHRLPEAVSRLLQWNLLMDDNTGDDKYDDPAVTIFNRWLTRMRSHFAAMPGLASLSFQRDQLIVRLLQGESAAVPLQGTYLPDGVTPEMFVTQKFIDGLDDLTALYSTPNMDEWLTDVEMRGWDPLPLTPNVLPQMPLHNRGTLNILAAPGVSDTALTVLPPGQSGLVGHPHFDDQFALYYNWQYKTAYLTPEALSSDVQSTEEITTSCPADLNGDGSVGVADLLILLSAWGPCDNPSDCPADLNGDGSVGVADLLILLANWG